MKRIIHDGDEEAPQLGTLAGQSQPLPAYVCSQCNPPKEFTAAWKLRRHLADAHDSALKAAKLKRKQEMRRERKLQEAVEAEILRSSELKTPADVLCLDFRKYCKSTRGGDLQETSINQYWRTLLRYMEASGVELRSMEDIGRVLRDTVEVRRAFRALEAQETAITGEFLSTPERRSTLYDTLMKVLNWYVHQSTGNVYAEDFEVYKFLKQEAKAFRSAKRKYTETNLNREALAKKGKHVEFSLLQQKLQEFYNEHALDEWVEGPSTHEQAFLYMEYLVTKLFMYMEPKRSQIWANARLGRNVKYDEEAEAYFVQTVAAEGDLHKTSKSIPVDVSYCTQELTGDMELWINVVRPSLEPRSERLFFNKRGGQIEPHRIMQRVLGTAVTPSSMRSIIATTLHDQRSDLTESLALGWSHSLRIHRDRYIKPTIQQQVDSARASALIRKEGFESFLQTSKAPGQPLRRKNRRRIAWSA